MVISLTDATLVGQTIDWADDLPQWRRRLPWVVAAAALHDISLTSAGTALTAFLSASAVGILVGGVMADRTERHDLVAALTEATGGGDEDDEETEEGEEADKA